MTCHSGGSVEILIQPVLPASRLLVFGLSPTARALARLGKAMGYAVYAVDPAADASAFPEADAVFADPGGLAVERHAAPVFAVVATQGQWDEDAVLAALAHEPDYLGVVASPKRFAEMKSLLAAKAPAAALARVKSPAGLDLGARLPEEIALSILAQIVKEQRALAPRALPLAEASSASSASPSAKDPVCGMTVPVSGAKHSAQHQGRDYFFCCAGCRERFLAAPEKYLTVGAAG
jgi:xanthine dehydrogenase accessory factor